MKTVTMNQAEKFIPTLAIDKPLKKGPSLFEVEYLRDLKNELELFLQSRNFSTIREVQVAFAGSDYTGLMQVKAS